MTSRESIASRFLRQLAAWVYHYPRLFFYPQVILVILSIFYTVDKLQFNTNRNDLVGRDKRYHHNFLKYREEFPGQDDLVTVVESENTEKNREFVERLGMRLEAESHLFTDVFYKGDMKMLGRKALLFVEEKNLAELRQTLRDFGPFLAKFSSATNLNSLFALINRQFRTATRERNSDNESLIKAVPAMERITKGAQASLSTQKSPISPGISALFGAGPEAEREIYITFEEGKLFLVTAHAVREELNMAAVVRLRELVQQTRTEVPGVNVGITGEPVLEVDEMAQSQYDTTVATIVSLVLVALIFIYGYQESGRPIKATLCLIAGLSYTLGFTTLVIGHLNLLTITFLPMLIGLAIDFGVHLISRYEEEVRHGKSEWEALQLAMVNTGLGIFTGCFTTAGAFLAMGITNFKGIQEMGIISGFGLLICLVPMITLLPVLLLRGRQNVLDHKKIEIDRRAQIEQIWLQRPWWVIAITLALCAGSWPLMKRVPFDYNLLHMQSQGLPAVETEHKLVNSASNSVLFGAIVADSLEHARRLQSQLTNLSTVASVKTMADYLGKDSAVKLQAIAEITRELASIHFAPLDKTPADAKALDQTLWALQGYLGLAVEEVNKENETVLAESLNGWRNSIGQLRRQMNLMGPSQVAQLLGTFQNALFQDVHETFEVLKNQDSSGALTVSDLPTALRNRFIGRSGKILLQVFPKHDVWQREAQEQFVRELRTVDPDVTGTPVQLYEYTTLLKESYQEAAWYSLAAIALLVLLHFRSLICVVLALIPVAVGTIWMVAFMGWQHIPFNPANIMTLPLVIGIGVTSGIHILNRFAEQRSPDILAKSTGKAVIVSALTTVAGFGSLILAKHQGIQSLGYVMAVGTATCMVAAVTFLPAIIHVLTRMGWQIKKDK